MTKAELADILEVLLRALRDSTEESSTTSGKVSFNSWLDTYEAQIASKGYKEQTIRNRKANIKHVRRLWGQTVITELKPSDLITKLRTEFIPNKLSTAQRVLAEVKEAFNEAIANSLVTSNPATHVKLPACRVTRKRLTLDVFISMLQYASTSDCQWLKPLLLLAVVTGQRRGDLSKMSFTDIVDGHLRVEQQKQAGKGFGARVAIPLNLKLNAIGLTVEEVLNICRKYTASGSTLIRKVSGEPLEVSSLSTGFTKCIRSVCADTEYKNKEWPSLHEIRSLSARLYKEQGIDIQTLLGHKNAEMTALYEDDRGLSAGVWKKVLTN